MLTQKRLREVLRYDPETGIFTWSRGLRKGTVAGTRHDNRGHMKVAIDGARHLLHRLAWLWMTGTMPRWSIAHVDGDRTNNRWQNLREGDRMQKKGHRAAMPEPTGIKNVWRVGDLFAAMIPVEGIVLNLGTFATVEDAQEAVRGAVQRARARQIMHLRRGGRPEGFTSALKTSRLVSTAQPDLSTRVS